MIGKDHIPSRVRPFGKSFSLVGLPLKCRQKPGLMQVNASQSQESSTFVNFFRRAARRLFPLKPQGKSGIRRQSCQRQEEKPHSPFFPCLCRNMEEGDDFRESRIVHFCHLHAKGCRRRCPAREGGNGIWGRPETDKHSVMNSQRKVFRLPLSPLTLKEATS